MIRYIMQRLGWETLCHPPYSPDLQLSDQPPLLHSLDNHLHEKFFTNEASLRQALTNLFASKHLELYRKRIEQLETRWQKVLDADGEYFEN
ncbi:histone-lysine N-methyltransferase SETMAR [Nephila pilipes]|uniref:Histone-lysine N-methyltransferase SETMAR n=1 Tax=Nephila pilipes TaxID=299642 RepID=A0A8X6NZ01_NEPPI|nr:histone-lysine N-methyltransferase SETMAR [Nephila pilipes]